MPTTSTTREGRRRPGRPSKEGLPERVEEVLKAMQADLTHEITVREVARRLSTSPTTLYTHGLGDTIAKVSEAHTLAMRRAAPKRARRAVAEQLAHITRERDDYKERYRNLLRMWQTLEYHLRERHGIDPAALYEKPIPEAKRTVGRSGARNPRLRPSK